MSTDAETTIVIFRKWRDASVIGDGVIALFPRELERAGKCLSYEHVGQHGAANLAYVISATRPATPAEYTSLQRELESEPYRYRLSVRKRMPRRTP